MSSPLCQRDMPSKRSAAKEHLHFKPPDRPGPGPMVQTPPEAAGKPKKERSAAKKAKAKRKTSAVQQDSAASRGPKKPSMMERYKKFMDTPEMLV